MIKVKCIENANLKEASTGKSLDIQVFTKDKIYLVDNDKYNNAHTIDDQGNNHCLGEFENDKVISNKFFDKYFINLVS